MGEKDVELRQVVELLKTTARELQRLQTEAREQLSLNSGQGYRDRMRQRAQLVQDLPGQIALLVGSSQGWEEVRLRLASWASLAADALEQDNTFAMAVLFTAKGDRTDDPTDLDRLIASLEASS